MRKLLLKCQLESKPVEIMYMDRQGRITQRSIIIKKIEEGHILAYCKLRNQQRRFELERILAAQKAKYSYGGNQGRDWNKSRVGS